MDFAVYAPQTLLLCKQGPETVFGDQSSSSASGTVYSAFRIKRRVQETALVSESQLPVAQNNLGVKRDAFKWQAQAFQHKRGHLSQFSS